MCIALNEIYHWLLFNQNAVGIKISKINIINDDFNTNSKVQLCTKYFNLSFEVIMFMHMHTFLSSEWIAHVCATILYVYVHRRNWRLHNKLVDSQTEKWIPNISIYTPIVIQQYN